jgi:hypothetical protein
MRVRHRDAAQRTLLTAIASGTSSIELAALMLTAITDLCVPKNLNPNVVMMKSAKDPV